MRDLARVEQLLQHPPECLSELERIVGRLDVDFAGREGFGEVRRLATSREREDPVGSSGDVHMSSWSVAPLAAAQAPPWALVLGRWQVEATLDGWPRGPDNAELPRVGRAGPSSLYDLRTCQNKVVWISIMPARTDA